jgi:hypothetical protein
VTNRNRREQTVRSERVKARPHCVHVASDFVECYKIDRSGNMLLVRSTSRMLLVACVSTLEQHIERFGEKITPCDM